VFYFLLALLILDAFVLTAVVLLQSGKGGGLAAMGAAGAGTDSLFGSRQATTLLTKATWWTGGIFLVLSFALSLLSGRVARPESILRGGLQQPVSAPAPAVPQTAPAGAAQPGATPAPVSPAPGGTSAPTTPAPAGTGAP
jgi:preprotein translocase subunit SecG